MKKSPQERIGGLPLRGIFILALVVSAPYLASQGYGQEQSGTPSEDSTSASSKAAAPADATARSGGEKSSESENAATGDAPSKQTTKTAPSESAKAPEPTEQVNAAAQIKPWQLNLERLFKGPTIKKFATPMDLTGRDRQILETLDYKPSGTKIRLQQIKKMNEDLKKAPIRSDSALNLTLSLLRLYEEQGMVFEWMRVVGIDDPKFPDLNQSLKTIRRVQALRYQELLNNYPKHPNVKQWKLKQTVARIKLGDPTVRDEAIAMLKTLQGNEQHEIAAVGLTLDAAASRLPSPFGTIEQVVQTSTDLYEGAALKLMLAEQEMSKNKPSAAIALLQDVIATCKNIRKADKLQTPSTFLQAAASLLIDVGLKSGTAVNQEVYQTLVNNDLSEYARAYLEEFALKSYSKSLPSALKAYGDALAAGQSSEQLKVKVEVRMLDLTIAANDPKMLSVAWERVISRGIQKSVHIDAHMIHSMNLVMNQFKAKPDKDAALRIVSLHDSFVRGFPVYAGREDYELKMIELLFQTKQYMDAGRRSELAVTKFKERANKVSAYEFNLRARSALMGLGTDIRIAGGQKLSGEPALASGYIANSEKLRNLLPTSEGEAYLYRAAFVQLLSGTKQISLVRYEEAFTRAPRHPLAADSASLLLEFLTQKKEFGDIEKISRLLIKSGVVPSREPYRNISKLLEQAVFEGAKQLLDTQQYDAAGHRFAQFHKEFPASVSAPQALEKAGVAFGLAKKPDFSMMAYELYLKLYPKLPTAKEIRWSAAELARNSKLYAKAAQQYQSYGQMYPEDASSRQVFLKAADSFRDANKIPEALSEYERHLKIQKQSDEQKKTLEKIAQLAQKSNNLEKALSAQERLSKLVKLPDEVISVNFNMFLMYQKLGRDEQAKKSASVVTLTRAGSADGFKMQAKSRFAIARYEIVGLRTRQVMIQKDLKVALQNLVLDYERVKANLLAPCEIPGLDWCSLGYYEVSKLSSDLAKLVEAVEPNSDLDESVVKEIKSLISANRDKFKAEAKSFALQAEDALTSSGYPDKDSLEKIKLYVQQMKQSGEDDSAHAGSHSVPE